MNEGDAGIAPDRRGGAEGPESATRRRLAGPGVPPPTSKPATQPIIVFSFFERDLNHLTAFSSGSFTLPSLSSTAPAPCEPRGPADIPNELVPV